MPKEEKSLTMIGEVLPKRPREEGWELPPEILISTAFTETDKDVIKGFMRYSNNAEIAKSIGVVTSTVGRSLSKKVVIAEINKQCNILRARQNAARAEALYKSSVLSERQNQILSCKARGLSDEDITAITGIDINVVKAELKDERLKGQLDIIYRERAEARKNYKYQDVLNDSIDMLHKRLKEGEINDKSLVDIVKTMGKFVGDDAGTSKLTIIAQNVQVNKDVQVLPNGEKPSW